MIFYFTEREGGPWVRASNNLPRREFITKIGNIHYSARRGHIAAMPQGFHSVLIAPGARWDEVNRTWVKKGTHAIQWRWLRQRDKDI